MAPSVRYKLLTLIFGLGAWEGFVRGLGIQPVVLPSLSSVAGYFYFLTLDGTLPYHLSKTLIRILSGFGLAALCGVALGLLMGMSRGLGRVADLLLAALYPLPKVSLIPLLVIWLGVTDAYKIMMGMIGAFFPITINTFAGLRRVDKELVKAAVDLGARTWQVQRKVIFPSALPEILAGLRVGMGVSVILVVASEMVASRDGIGRLLASAGHLLQTERVFVMLTVLSLLGLALSKGHDVLERRLAPWAFRPKD